MRDTAEMQEQTEQLAQQPGPKVRKPRIIRELPKRPQSLNVSEGLMQRLFTKKRESQLEARLIVEAWNPWRTLPIVVMPADEFDRLVEQQKFLHFGSGA